MQKTPLFLMAGLVALSLSFPAHAASEKKERIWGGAVCSKPLPCANLISLTPDMPALISIVKEATDCVKWSFSYKNPSGDVFNISRGINSSLCLTSEKLPTKFVPRCCFKPTEQSDMCRLECVLVER